MKEEVRNFGCLRQNCDTFYWTSATEHDVDYKRSPGYIPKTSLLQYEFQRSSVSYVTRETLSYTPSNFIADVGGFLGLLLGASILSIYDAILLGFKKLLNQKHSETTSNSQI